MTQKEKEEAYAEANYNNYKSFNELIERLESVKNAIKEHNYGIAMDVLCKPYPEFQITTSTELKESEDERMRKKICKLLWDNAPYEEAQEYIAWLEKHGEQKPVPWSEEDENTIKDIIEDLEYAERKGYVLKNNTFLKEINWLKSLITRKWKPSEEQMKALHDLNLTGNISYAGQGQVLIELYKQLKKLG